MAKVAPEPNNDEQSDKSTKSSTIAFENPELSSAITGKVIGPIDTLNTLQLPDRDQRIKSSYQNHKRLPRSVSEVVEEKEKQEKNVITRFG